jgi:hypothetical protein
MCGLVGVDTYLIFEPQSEHTLGRFNITRICSSNSENVCFEGSFL